MNWMDAHPWMTFFLTCFAFGTIYDLGMKALNRPRK